jgi:hypothetical protein
LSFTYVVSTDIGKVRMLIPDRDEPNAIFQDDEIQAFLDLNDASVKRAAAEALETIASDQALTLKVISTLDLTTNGASLSSALLERAKVLRTAADLAEEGEDDVLFDYAEIPETIFQKRERVTKQGQRTS